MPHIRLAAARQATTPKVLAAVLSVALIMAVLWAGEATAGVADKRGGCAREALCRVSGSGQADTDGSPRSPQRRRPATEPEPEPAALETSDHWIPPPLPVPSGQDALVRRVRAELAVFTDWLARHDVDGYIGEVGWPNSMPADMGRWNALASAWFDDARAARLWVSAWATGEWWPRTHDNSIYIRSEGSLSLDTPRPQAKVLEAQPAGPMRGINVNGGEFGTPRSLDDTHSFSNANPGAYNTAYHYDRQESFDYLASRRITTVRLAFRWERIQPTLGGPLNTAERDRLTAAVARAHQAGLRVILDVHNYGAYYLDDGTKGVRRAIGSQELPRSHFTDLWRRLSVHFKDNPGVVAYGLMNEPVGMPALPGGTEAQQWERASQEALDAIRGTGDTTTVLVSGYLWSPTWRWSTVHPSAWIRDPADNVRYEAHHYFDRNRSGAYSWSYDEEVVDATLKGF